MHQLKSKAFVSVICYGIIISLISHTQAAPTVPVVVTEIGSTIVPDVVTKIVTETVSTESTPEGTTEQVSQNPTEESTSESWQTTEGSETTEGVTTETSETDSSQLSTLMSELSTLAPTNNSECEDLVPNCSPDQCSNDRQRIMCGKTCQTCYLRDVCYNAYGDDDCENLSLFCGESSNMNVACKKTCEGCQPQPPCQDIFFDCRVNAHRCNSRFFQAFCANTCQACAQLNGCGNLFGDSVCQELVKSDKCDDSNFLKVVCKNACGAC